MVVIRVHGAFARFVALSASVALLTTALPRVAYAADVPAASSTLAVAAAAPNAEASEPVVVRELTDKRTTTSKEYLLSDGTIRANYFTEPVNYRSAKSGKLEPIDTSLVDTVVDGNAVAVNRANSFLLTLPAKLQEDAPATIETSECVIEIRPAASVRPGEAQPAKDAIALSRTGSAGGFYEGAFSGTRLEYESRGGGLKETLVLAAVPKSTTWAFDLTLSGLTPRLEDNGSISLLRPGSKVADFVMPAPYMLDSSEEGSGNEYSDNVRYAISGTAPHYRLTLTADASWLSDAARVYPVRIDPTVETSVAVLASANDTYISSKSANQPVNFVTHTLLWVNNHDPDENWTEFIYMQPTSALVTGMSQHKTAGRVVVASRLKLYLSSTRIKGAGQFGGSMCATSTSVSLGSITWDSYEAGNPPAQSYFYTPLKTLAGGTNTLDVTTMVAHWQQYSVAQNRCTVRLSCTSGAHAGFCAADYGSNKPVWEIDYAPAPEVTLSSPTSGTVTTVPQAAWTYTEALGNPQVEYEVQVATSTAGAPCATGGASTAATSCALPVPSGGFAPGTTYYVRVRAASSPSAQVPRLWSSWSSWGNFTYGARLLSGTVSSDTTCTADTTWLVEGIVSVAPGTRLGIEQGCVVKFKANASLSVSGTLSAIGSADAPIVFTALTDDTHGGDTNGDGSATGPSRGYWGCIKIGSGSVDSRVENAVLLYGGANEDANIIVASDSATIKNTSSRESASAGLSIEGSSPVIDQCTFQDNSGAGLASANGGGTVSACEITDNDGFGVDVSGTSAPSINHNDLDGNTLGGLSNATGAAVNARYNYWGESGAPFGEESDWAWLWLYSSLKVEGEHRGGKAGEWAMAASLHRASPIVVGEWSDLGSQGGYGVGGWRCAECGVRLGGCLQNWTPWAFSHVFSPLEFGHGYVLYGPGKANWLSQPTIGLDGENLDEGFFELVMNHYELEHGGMSAFFLSDDYWPSMMKPWRSADGRLWFGAYTGCGSALEPVNTSTGNFYYSATDISCPGIGPRLEVARTYNSLDNDAWGPMGYGWSASFSSSVCPGKDGAVTVFYPDSRGVTFTPNGAGGYRAPEGVLDVLVASSGGTFTLRLPDQSERHYDARGLMDSERDRYGNQVTYEYEGVDSQVTKMIASGGRYLELTYDPSCRLIKVRDNAGRFTLYKYNTAGELAEVTDPSGATAKYVYESEHLIASVSSPKWPAQPFVMNHFDDKGRVIRQHDGYESTATVSYDDILRVTTMVDNRGATITHKWDAERRLTDHTDGVGNTTGRTYNAAGLLDSITDGNDHTTTFAYDGNGNRTSTTDPANHTTSASFDTSNNMLWSEDAEDVRTTYSYDESGKYLESVANPVFTILYEHFTNGLVQSMTLGDATTSYEYDTKGNLTEVTDPLGHASTLAYDSASQLTTTTDALGRSVTFAYDTGGHLTKTTDPLGETVTFAYDDNGNRTSATDQLGNATAFTYDVMDKLVGVEDPLGNEWAYTYDANYNLSTVTNPRSATTTYTYTANDLLERTTDPLGHEWSFARDAAGNTTESVYPTGETVSRTFTADDLVAATAFSTGETYGFTYSPAHRLTGVTDAEDRTWTYAYNPVGWLTSAADTANGTTFATTYAYDASGRVTGLAASEEGTRAYAYDLAGDITSLTLPGASESATYTHDAARERTGVSLPNGAVTAYAYDPAGRLASVATTLASGVIASAYTRDETGRVTSENAERFGYDDAGRLSTWYDPSADATTTYAFDAASNLTGVSVAGTPVATYTVDAADRINNAGFTYDAAGNLTSDGTRDFAYDAACRLTTVRDASTEATIATYNYDAMNRRVSATEASGTVFFHYDGAPARVIAETDGTGATIATYAYDDRGQLHAMARGGETYFYHLNARGDVVALSDASGDVVNTYRYDPWGTLIDSDETVENPYRYASYRADAATGLYYCWNRYYAPELGRFLTRDIYPGETSDPVTMNPYLYCGGDPVNRVDPSGMASVEFIGEGETLRLIIGGTTLEVPTIAVGVSVGVLVIGLANVIQAGILGNRAQRDWDERIDNFKCTTQRDLDRLNAAGEFGQAETYRQMAEQILAQYVIAQAQDKSIECYVTVDEVIGQIVGLGR